MMLQTTMQDESELRLMLFSEVDAGSSGGAPGGSFCRAPYPQPFYALEDGDESEEEDEGDEDFDDEFDDDDFDDDDDEFDDDDFDDDDLDEEDDDFDEEDDVDYDDFDE